MGALFDFDTTGSVNWIGANGSGRQLLSCSDFFAPLASIIGCRWGQFSSVISSLVIGLQSWLECGNLCRVSARSSLGRHYLLSHFFQSSFGAFFFYRFPFLLLILLYQIIN